MENKEKKLIADEVKDRNKEILKVESNVKELYHLFNDLEMIIKSQEELMNNIETNVNFAVEYTEKAQESLEKVESAKNKNIKLKFSALFAVVLLAFLLYFIGMAVVCFYVPVLCKN